MTLRNDVKDGRDSGYPYCCIGWYLVRCRIKDSFGWYLNLPWERLGAGHVRCPLHAYLTPKKSHTCENCNWVQYGIVECKRCAHCRHSFPFDEPLCSECGYERRPVAFTFRMHLNGQRELIKIYDDK